MKTFKEFLTESEVIQEIQVTDIEELLNSEYSEAYSNYLNGVVIYKGFRQSQRPMIFKPAKGARKSAYTYNYYTYIVDNSPDYSEYPKRAKSLICTTSEETAKGFGDAYVVFPKNSAKVVVCPARDFWFSFDTLSEIRLDLESFNYALKGLFDDYKLALDDNTYESFINSLKTLDKLISIQGITDSIKKTTSTSKRLLEALAKNGYKGFDIIDYLEEILEPKGFGISSIDAFSTKGNFEVYTSSDCLILSERFLQK